MAQSQRRKRRILTPEGTWRGIIDDCRRSGLPYETFCERENYSPDGFRIYHEKLFGCLPEGQSCEPSGHDFAPVRLVERKAVDAKPRSAGGHQDSSGEMSVLDVVLTNGIVLRVGSDCPLGFLQSVVSVLETR